MTKRPSDYSFNSSNDTLLVDELNIPAVVDIFSKYEDPEANDNINKEVQCDLLNEHNILHHIDPTRLSYHERLTWHLNEFCNKTSSHGIPMLSMAPNYYYKITWIVLLVCCLCMFVYHAIDVVAKYQKNAKITDIQLQFDTAPFPAITICNLNPYKDSVIRNVDKIKKILDIYSDVMIKAGEKNKLDEEIRLETKSSSLIKRKKRDEDILFEVAYSDCTCETSAEIGAREECTENSKNLPNLATDYCLCAFDRASGDAWPCHRKSLWSNNECASCDKQKLCKLTNSDGSPSLKIPCVCYISDENFCVEHNPAVEILKLWEYYGIKIGDEKKIIEALGFRNMSDEVAIVTKAKENIIFAMSELSEAVRRSLSIQKHQLIQKCSFNGAACDIDNDFKIVTDPTFGNCFTFNHNMSEIKSSIRAGPTYGLRMLVYVNASDYLPTTEAVGVRVTIHDKDEYPFPDTFGYNAPTGYISSFGMKLQKMNRLPAPFGNCIPRGFNMTYIYKDYRYSTEGCYRSCFQNMVQQDCGCGDPRFPILNGSHCQAFNPVARKCLEEKTNQLGDVNGTIKCSECHQPCEQSVYTVSYSAAIWPSESLNITLGSCADALEKCNEHYKENGAMIEMFYEALNFEVFTESEAYGIVKMMADFGGQLGLWSGVSFLTCCEFVMLFFEIIYMVITHHYNKKKQKKLEKEKDKFAF
uniref:Degenerin mec-10 (inferred by orthology to a C. elegans protein) n=1 Tax=Strongyloides venezuelensis TaxID=75913 RepID=A0A0K0FMN3_STRVS